ncbi:MAG TPA: class I SAM-dependent methyltransferase [Anaerolineae bacterium]|nr:class I SAM-dependent methyltransferase [Anaerolineae bacterium]
MAAQRFEDPNEQTRQAWEANAGFWDGRMGEGNDFVEILTWPATERLLGLMPGERVLDIACGNGLTSRRLAILGAEVVAFDFSANLIDHARRRTEGAEIADRITYHVLDATDEAALLRLGPGTFDAALCAMALFDMAEIGPLLRGVARLLRPGGRFVFSVIHPCFNNAHVTQMAEMEDREGELVTVYSVKVRGYLTPTINQGIAIAGQPVPQLYFHRPLHVLLSAVFDAGLVLDGLEERAFPPDVPAGRHPLSWSGHFSEIPPVLVARARLAGAPQRE